MTEVDKRRADELISGYMASAPKYRKARIKACELQAVLNPHASDYWMYIAKSLSEA
jgi:hypothetical protein